jgi:hypothetical protein
MRTHLWEREIGVGRGGWVKSAEVKKGIKPSQDLGHSFSISIYL